MAILTFYNVSVIVTGIYECIIFHLAVLEVLELQNVGNFPARHSLSNCLHLVCTMRFTKG